MAVVATDNKANLEGRLADLAIERGELFDTANATGRLTAREQERLLTVERERDECFLARRASRAERDAQRFDREQTSIRRNLIARPAQ